MADVKETKRIAGRIDIRYIDRPSWFAWWRRWLVSLTALVAIVWLSWVTASYFRNGNHAELFNPGPVAMAHARFEQNCAACHAPGPKGGFSRAVSDHACLSCHDAGSHHPHAMLNPLKPGEPQLINLIDTRKAANCVACHVEHRGSQALLGTDDRLCTQCHRDLQNHLAAREVLSGGFASAVSAFPSSHPAFGRRLLAEGVALPNQKPASRPATAASRSFAPREAWLPVLVMKFNHRTHIGPASLARIENCSTCHTTRLPDPRAIDAPLLPVERGNPPQDELKTARKMPGPRRASGSTSNVGADMQSVRYEQNCRSCHPIGLPITPDLQMMTRLVGSAGPTTKVSVPQLTHDRIQIVRAQLSDVDHLYLDLLSTLPDGRSLLNDPETHKVRSPLEWLGQQKMELAERLAREGAGPLLPPGFVKDAKALNTSRIKLAAELKKKKPDPDTVGDLKDQINELLPKVRTAAQALPPPSMQAACEEMVTKLNNEANCAKCHFTDPQVKAFVTLPTGVPSTPRRWFEGARFNHDKHRDMRCLDCHAGIDKDEDGTEKNQQGEIVARYVLRLPGIETCAKCHFPDSSKERGAGSACITCHNFHDRSLERPP